MLAKQDLHVVECDDDDLMMMVVVMLGMMIMMPRMMTILMLMLMLVIMTMRPASRTRCTDQAKPTKSVQYAATSILGDFL